MPAKIRVFVSSTMEDLANERQAVVEAIESLNLQPVNAEGVLPTGGTSWDVLEEEIRTSHICILIQGERYGWMPTEGYGGGQGKSVTHLEIALARSEGIAVLPFLKRLKYGADAASPDALLRDQFRKEIGDWTDGMFRSEFDLASDLKRKASDALLDVFTATYLRTAVQARVSKARAPSGPLAFEDLTPTLPREQMAGSAEVLFAGAGLSLSAGYPSANALSGVLVQTLGLDPALTADHSLAQLFEFAQTKIGRDQTYKIVLQLLNPPLPVEPTSAHIAAVRRFPIILTTNYDQLFERACEMVKTPFVVLIPGEERRGGAPLPADAVRIFKIDGSVERPESLVLSPSDALRARRDEAFWHLVEAVLRTSRPIVIGHSMRDETSLRLMSGRNLDIPGVYVAPAIDPIDGGVLLNRLNLKGVESSASAYLWAEP